MTSIVILAITVCEIKIGHRGRATVVVTTKVLRGRICEGREVKGVLRMVRLSKLVHVAIVGGWRVREQDRSRRQELSVVLKAKAFFLCG